MHPMPSQNTASVRNTSRLGGDGFIVTKPLQLMVMFAIFEQLDASSEKHILIVGNFAGALQVSSKLENICPANWTVQYFETEKLAYAFAIKVKFENLYIDSDVGFRQYLTLTRLSIYSPSTSLAVYEEGIGSYRTDLYHGKKAAFLRFLGCGIFFGGSRYAKKIFLFEPQQCITAIRSEKVKIICSISQLVSEKRYFIEAIFGKFDVLKSLPKNSDLSSCLLYLTNWNVDEDRIEDLVSRGETLIIKPHPHIQDAQFLKWGGKLILAPAGVPAELVIGTISEKFERVTVLHHGSSVERYIKPPNVRYESVC